MRHTPYLAMLVAAVLLGGCSPLTFTVGGSPADHQLRATVVDPDGRLASDRVAIIDVSGLIMNSAKPRLLQPGENPVSLLNEQLVAAGRDRRVKAVILRLNTPGGSVTASDAMYREIHRFREQTGKPVVALLMDVAASGGYYVACAADQIIAYPTSVTGSIGVIVQTISVKPALSRIGVQAEAITSGANKDAGSPLSVLSDAHRQVLQKLVDDFYARFLDVVKRARPNIRPDQFSLVTDGRVFSGEQSLALGLTDATGDMYDAVASAKALAGISEADLVLYHRRFHYVGSPYAVAPGPAPYATPPGAGMQMNLVQLNFDGLGILDMPVGFYYLWRPDLP